MEGNPRELDMQLRKSGLQIAFELLHDGKMPHSDEDSKTQNLKQKTDSYSNSWNFGVCLERLPWQKQLHKMTSLLY